MRCIGQRRRCCKTWITRLRGQWTQAEGLARTAHVPTPPYLLRSPEFSNARPWGRFASTMESEQLK